MHLAATPLRFAAGAHMIAFVHCEVAYSKCLLTTDKCYARRVMPCKSANIGLPPSPPSVPPPPWGMSAHFHEKSSLTSLLQHTFPVAYGLQSQQCCCVLGVCINSKSFNLD